VEQSLIFGANDDILHARHMVMVTTVHPAYGFMMPWSVHCTCTCEMAYHLIRLVFGCEHQWVPLAVVADGLMWLGALSVHVIMHNLVAIALPTHNNFEDTGFAKQLLLCHLCRNLQPLTLVSAGCNLPLYAGLTRLAWVSTTRLQ
jgi:hypothetical protein